MSDSQKLPFSLAMNINTRDETTGEVLQEIQNKPFCIAMMGNFSGRQGVTETSIGDRNFIPIDRYNYDEVLASMGLVLSLKLDRESDNTVDVELHSLKDFHPDNLYKNVAVFGQLRDLRNRLNNRETFAEAMKEFGLQSEQDDTPEQLVSATSKEIQPPSSVEQSVEASGISLLDSIMSETEGQPKYRADSAQSDSHPVQGKALVDDLIQKLVAGRRKSASRDPRQDELVASVDEEITQQMRNLLHHPQFQALEATWRAVHFMVKRIRGNEVKLYLLDVNQTELESDLAIDDVTQTQLYIQFCDTSVGDINWSLIVGDYQFRPDIDDILQLSQLGLIAQQAGAQFISAADEKLVGCNSFAETPKADKWLFNVGEPVQEAWALLRKSPVAKNISLSLPRVMLRVPYGIKDTPVKAFAFEELSDPPKHAEYLWGNPAFIKAEQIARAFTKSGWDLQYANVMNTDDLPVHYYEEGGRTIVKPCAEISLTDTGASKMVAQGLIPLWSVKNSDRVHSGDFHSIAE